VLKYLKINNIVLIKKAEINFEKGLCILSGETGSGKSILLDALGLAVGFRSNARLIGSSENKGSVEAIFDISNNSECLSLLKENEILDVENSSELRIRRIISLEEKDKISNKIYLNDVLIGVNLAAKIGETLIEIHGQHQQGNLINSSFHIKILDEFAANRNDVFELGKIYQKIKEISEKIREINNKKEQLARDKDYLNFVIQEIKNSNIEKNEEEELVKKRNIINAYEKITTFVNELKNKINDAQTNLILANKNIARNQNLINNFLANQTEEFSQIEEKIDAQNSTIDEITESIEKIVSNLSIDENLSEIEERLFLIRNLSRKYNCSSDQLNEIVADAETKLQNLIEIEDSNQNLVIEQTQQIKNYFNLAKKISQKRVSAAKTLSKKVEEELLFLKMASTKFLVEVKNDISTLENLVSKEFEKFSQDEIIEKIISNFSVSGFDKVKFLASINNNNFDEISKIASGGELSRFMLSLKVALMEVRSTETIIFDEIDAGVGGNTADAIGKRLKKLAENYQILVVTHQPQIAAKADQHLQISKINEKNLVKTMIQNLNSSEKISEIARMISGEKITSEAIAAAEKLINQDQ
jgi:DNA repair protein RecN (Recombination protein N)